ncbi:MAG: AEC family transporter [Verrucomicrobia bacterium]|nr:AEC family transporter [Verrucomicrobiota bacterium]
MNYSDILAATLPVYLMMLIGALARWMRWLPREADAGIMNVSIRVLFPCLAFERIVGNEALKDGGQTLLAALVGFGLVATSMLVCYAMAPLIGLKRGEGARTFGLCVGLQNYGYMAIPVIEALFGKQLIGVLFTYTLGVEIAMWTVGVGLLTGLSKAPWRHAINAPVIAILASLALHYAGAGPHVPETLHKLAGQLGACAIPLSVLLIGASIFDLIGTERIRWAVALASPVLRLAVLPMGFLLAGYWLPMSPGLKKIMCVQAAMPSAVFTIVLARQFGGHAATAVLVVVSTTLVSLFTAPWMIGFAMRFLGL